MPDTRQHRGAHPADHDLFSARELPQLRQAQADFGWLLDRGYAPKSSLALVGDRYNLPARQRIALARCACTATAAAARQARRIREDCLRGAEIWVDGYNLLISIEAALAGGVILAARDGCYRDLASLHGTYRTVTETVPGLELIGSALAASGVHHVHWILDRPVSNSGRLKTLMEELAAQRGWSWDVELEFSPDAVLKSVNGIIVSSDSVILDACTAWANVARDLITAQVPGAFVVDLSPTT